ncbi:MAG TPA: hypothetical protein VFV93_11995 [Thermomicrobiales bacterium]|nr:hypothetical protein [Thermomicrobiales bacterium]
MTRTQLRWMVPVLALIGLLVFSVSADAKGAETIVRLKGSSSYPGVSGKAKYKVDGTQREFEVEIEDANRLIGKTLTVSVNGKTVGTMRVNSFGSAALERNTRLRQTVPTITSGATVRITTSTGVLVASGRF